MQVDPVMNGRDSLARYWRFSPDVHTHASSDAQPRRHGLAAPTSWKRAGKAALPAARETTTLPSSRGWRSDSRTRWENSGSSSRDGARSYGEQAGSGAVRVRRFVGGRGPVLLIRPWGGRRGTEALVGPHIAPEAARARGGGSGVPADRCPRFKNGDIEPDVPHRV